MTSTPPCVWVCCFSGISAAFQEFQLHTEMLYVYKCTTRNSLKILVWIHWGMVDAWRVSFPVLLAIHWISQETSRRECYGCSHSFPLSWNCRSNCQGWGQLHFRCMLVHQNCSHCFQVKPCALHHCNNKHLISSHKGIYYCIILPHNRTGSSHKSTDAIIPMTLLMHRNMFLFAAWPTSMWISHY